jgi:signal transduction histidine kinase
MSGEPRPAPPMPDQLQAGLDAIDYGLALWTAHGRLAWCNVKFRELFHGIATCLAPGLSHDEFLDRLAHSNELATELSTQEWIARGVAEFEQGGIAEQMLSDGRFYEISRSVAAGGLRVIVVHDITPLKRGERALRQAKELADAADRTKSRFLRAANHDLRQPLATLKILIYNCMTTEDDRHRQDLLHAMDISVGIMEDLLGALLNIGQLDAGKIVPRITTFQVSRLLERLEVEFGHQAAEKGLSFGVVHSHVAISSDRALLERVISNFVANAIRYTEVGRVLLGCRRVGDSLRIEVWDTGPGIAADHRERIFEEFYQVHDIRRRGQKGLGLGLNIAKRLATLLGHAVDVRSWPGHGSMFAITVPLGDVWHSEIGEPEISEMIGGEFVGINVLVVEDDDILRQAVKELLERWGIAVHAVHDLEQAEALIRDHGFVPRLVVCDYRLRSGIDGTDVVLGIRNLLGQAVPSIIVTADTDPKLIAQIRERGFPVLIKPVSPPRLRVLMHNLVYEPDMDRPATPAAATTA